MIFDQRVRDPCLPYIRRRKKWPKIDDKGKSFRGKHSQPANRQRAKNREKFKLGGKRKKTTAEIKKKTAKKKKKGTPEKGKMFDLRLGKTKIFYSGGGGKKKNDDYLKP